MPIIKVVSLSPHGTGISGGDRIWIEFVRFWQKKTNIHLITWDEGLAMFRRQQVSETKRLKITLLKSKLFKKSFLVSYIWRIVRGIIWAFTESIDQSIIIYSASEFWMDAIPAFILKLRNKHCIWVASWYQTAPGFLKGFGDNKRDENYRLSSFFYWLSQLPIKPLIIYLADFVLVNNESERTQFLQLRKEQVLVVRGAVRLDQIKKWQIKHPTDKKVYDAVFQGRFHPQKGVEELVDIWQKVCLKFPQAKLVMIGDGPLKEKVKARIIQLDLQQNIILKGFVFDGNEKYSLFSQSKIVVHPAFFDSGGMAAAEAMAFGLPCVGFDLPAYRSYYPSGMIKVPIGKQQKFAKAIIALLRDARKRVILGNEAKKMVVTTMDWEKRSRQVYEKIRYVP